MSRDFGKIATSIWRSKKFKKLGDNSDAKLLYIYLLTNSNGNSIGVYELPTGYIMADLRWDDSRINRAMIALCEALLIGWNEEEEVVSIGQFLKKSPITNKKHAIGAFKTALSLPDCAEKINIIKEIVEDKYASELGEVKAYLDGLDSPIDSPMHTTETETETETQTETQTQTQTETETQTQTLLNDQTSFSSSNKPHGEEEMKLSDDENWLLHGDGFGWFWMISGAGSSQEELRVFVRGWINSHGAQGVREVFMRARQPDIRNAVRYIHKVFQDKAAQSQSDTAATPKSQGIGLSGRMKAARRSFYDAK